MTFRQTRARAQTLAQETSQVVITNNGFEFSPTRNRSPSDSRQSHWRPCHLEFVVQSSFPFVSLVGRCLATSRSCQRRSPPYSFASARDQARHALQLDDPSALRALSILPVLIIWLGIDESRGRERNPFGSRLQMSPRAVLPAMQGCECKNWFWGAMVNYWANDKQEVLQTSG